MPVFTRPPVRSSEVILSTRGRLIPACDWASMVPDGFEESMP